MNFSLVSINDPKLESILAQIVGEDFGLSEESAKFLISQKVIRHLERFRQHTKLIIEREDTLDYRPLILAMCNGSLLQYDKNNKAITSYQMTGSSFSIFDENLKEM